MTTDKKIIIFNDQQSLSEFALRRWRKGARAAVLKNGRFLVALSGGKTPVFLYEKLAHQRYLPWSQTHIFWVDERFVDSAHEESNHRLIHEILIRHVPIPAANVHPVCVRYGELSGTAKDYEDHLRKFFSLSQGEFPEFDLVVLGIGEDGHTASLFPGALIDSGGRWVMAVSSSRLKYQRITLTLSVLNCAGEVIFLGSSDF